MAVSTVGFDINSRLVEFRLPELTPAQRIGTKRNDQPGSENNLVFVFKMNSDAEQEGDLIVRGPTGFVFHDDCLTSVETLEDKVYFLRMEKKNRGL